MCSPEKLSTQLTTIAAVLSTVLVDLEKAGFSLHKSYQDFVLLFSCDENAKNALKKYWNEKTKVTLSCLGSYDAFDGYLPAYSCYRSEYIDGLRSEALSQLNDEQLTTRQLDKTLIEFTLQTWSNNNILQDWQSSVARHKKVEITSNFTSDLVADLLMSCDKDIASQFRALFCASESMLGMKFDAKRSKKGMLVLAKTVANSDWDICYIGEVSGWLQSGSIEANLAIVPTGKSIDPRRRRGKDGASLWFEDLIPGFGQYRVFSSFEHMLLGVKSYETLVKLVVPKLELALSIQ